MIRFIQSHVALLDGIGIVLCLAIIGYLVGNHLKYVRMLRRQAKMPDFGDQVMRSMAAQQIREVLMAVAAKVDRELQSKEEGNREDAPGNDLFSKQIDWQRVDPVSGGGGGGIPPASRDPGEESISKVSGLMEAGLGLADISRSLRRPLAEVELCAWLGQHQIDEQDDAGPDCRRQ